MKILLLLCALLLSYMPLSQAAQMPNTPVALHQVTSWQVTGGDQIIGFSSITIHNFTFCTFSYTGDADG